MLVGRPVEAVVDAPELTTECFVEHPDHATVSPAWISLPPSFRKSRTAIVTYCSRSATELSGRPGA